MNNRDNNSLSIEEVTATSGFTAMLVAQVFALVAVCVGIAGFVIGRDNRSVREIVKQAFDNRSQTKTQD